jgi:hypothetical protein
VTIEEKCHFLMARVSKARKLQLEKARNARWKNDVNLLENPINGEVVQSWLAALQDEGMDSSNEERKIKENLGKIWKENLGRMAMLNMRPEIIYRLISRADYCNEFDLQEVFAFVAEYVRHHGNDAKIVLRDIPAERLTQEQLNFRGDEMVYLARS